MAANTYSKATVLKSFLWKLMEKCSVQGVSFIVTVILARILSPEEYGIVAIVTIFLHFSNILIEGGFSAALIQKKGYANKDFSTIFYFSLLVALAIYIILFIGSGAIASFFNEQQLRMVIKVLGINVFFCAINSIQKAYVSKKMLFKKMFVSSLASAIISGGIAIFLAWKGWGVWALVFYSIISQTLITATMWFTVRWRPTIEFSTQSFKQLFNFGWKIMATHVIISIFTNIRSIIISKFYTATMLAYFDKGKQLPGLAMENINSSIQTILFPVFSEAQDDKNRVKQMIRRSIKTNSLFVFPMMVALALMAEDLVITIYTEKWIAIVPYIQIFAISYILMPMQLANIEAIKSLGYSNITLKLEIIKKVIEVIILIISSTIGVLAIAWGVVIYNFICLFINLYPNTKLLKYSLYEQLHDFLPQLFASLLMGVCIFSTKFMYLGNLTTLFVQFIVGLASYFIICKLFKLESFEYIYKSITKKK